MYLNVNDLCDLLNQLDQTNIISFFVYNLE